MSIYLDIGVVVILVIAMITGWRRGVARSVIRLVGAVASLILSSLLASSLAPYVFDALVRPSLTGKIEQVLATGPTQDIAQKLQELFHALPQFVSSSLNQYGITSGQMEQILAGGTQDTAKTLVDTISPIVIDPIRVVLMILLFLIFMVVVGILARARTAPGRFSHRTGGWFVQRCCRFVGDLPCRARRGAYGACRQLVS